MPEYSTKSLTEILKNPFKSFYDLFCGIKKEEWPKVISMALFFFLVIAIFWILKPLKRGLLVSFYQDAPLRLLGMTLFGAEVEQLAKVLNMVFAFLMVIGFTFLYKKVSRKMLVTVISLLFAGMFVMYGFMLQTPSHLEVWSFYIFGDMFNTALVTLFWAFTNDIFTSEQAKRAYGFVGLGGIIGGIVGSTYVTLLVQQLGRETLLYISVIPMLLIILITFYIEKREKAPKKSDSVDAPKTNAVVEGAKLVFQSKYLIAIAAMLGIYEMVSNIIDFQLSAAIALGVEGGLERDAYFGLVGMITNIAAVFVQMFLTGLVMINFGVGIALLLLPVSIALGSLGFFIIPGLLFATIMSASDNSLNYSIQQSAKEALYTPTSRDVKYKAKAFIDMFIQRGAKAVAVFLNIGVAVIFGVENVFWLSLVVLVLVVVWIMLVRYMGRTFKSLEKDDDH
ncbi:MAG: NTP/NDP exchange transporter [Balneolaceae bacterium]